MNKANHNLTAFTYVGFISSVIGSLGLLLGFWFFLIFPIPIFCGIMLIKYKRNKKDIISGISCIVVSAILIFYIVYSIFYLK